MFGGVFWECFEVFWKVFGDVWEALLWYVGIFFFGVNIGDTVRQTILIKLKNFIDIVIF